MFSDAGPLQREAAQVLLSVFIFVGIVLLHLRKHLNKETISFLRSIITVYFKALLCESL